MFINHQKRTGWGRYNLLTTLKGWLSRCNQNKRKTVAPHITHLCSLLLLLTISSKLVASYSWQVPSVFACLHFFSHSCSLTETMPRKFQVSGESRFGGSEKDHYFLKTSKYQHELVQEYKWEKYAYHFLDNAAKTCSHRLKISENIEIKHVFQSRSFFFVSVTFSTQVASAPLNKERK